MNILRKMLQTLGFDFHRYYPKPNKMKYVQSLGIHTILDIGANTGQFAQEIRHTFPDAHIYSFEPISECFSTLTHNMSNDTHFTAFNYALGEKNETIEMEKNEYSPSSSILPLSNNHKELFPHAKNTTHEKITVKKLDDIISTLTLQPELLIKVDVQGFEDKVIAGGTQTFSRAKVLILETSFVELYQGQPSFADIYKTLTSLGFTYKGSIQEKVDKHSGKIISEDSLFVR